MEPLTDAKVVSSWHRNADAWTVAVREGAIASRVLVTNAAIEQAVLATRPTRVLDVGTGEGWLCRRLAAHGVSTTGIDVVPALIEHARSAHIMTPAGEYLVQSYEEIAAGALTADYAGDFDVVVSNFALIGDDSVRKVLSALPTLVRPGGRLIIQTLHPVVAGGEAPYVDGWRAGSWAGFSDDFTDPAPWYFRTISGWIALLSRSGWQLSSLAEPVHPETGKPLSLLLTANVTVVN